MITFSDDVGFPERVLNTISRACVDVGIRKRNDLSRLVLSKDAEL